MSRYSQTEKEQILTRLSELNWDVPLASLELKVPERTLYRWKRQWQEKYLSLPQLPSSFGKSYKQIEKELNDNFVVGEYTDLRHQLMSHINTLVPTLSQDPDLAHRRVLALTRLLDRVLQLEELVRAEKVEPLVIKYETPDGYLHDMPYYRNDLLSRAMDAYDAVLEHARITYYRQQGYDEREIMPKVDLHQVLQDSIDNEGTPNPYLLAVLSRPFDTSEFHAEATDSFGSFEPQNATPANQNASTATQNATIGSENAKK